MGQKNPTEGGKVGMERFLGGERMSNNVKRM